MSTDPPSKRLRISDLIPLSSPGGEKKGNPDLSALIISDARFSPNTSRTNAISQFCRQGAGAEYLRREFPNVDFSCLRMVNVAEQHSRHEGFGTSSASEHLLDQITQYQNQFDVIIPLFTETLRIGEKKEHIVALKKKLSKFPNVSLLTLSDAGKDLEKVAELIEKKFETKRATGEVSSHKDAGKNLHRSAKSQEVAKQIQAKRETIRARVEETGILDDRVLAALKAGQDLMGEIKDDTKNLLVESVRSIDRDDSEENINIHVEKWKFHVRTCVNVNEEAREQLERLVIIYSRTTPTEHAFQEIDEEEDIQSRKYIKYIPTKTAIPVFQSSGCFAAMDCVNEGRDEKLSNAVFLNDYRKTRYTIKRDGIMRAMIMIGCGKAKALVMNNMNRAGGRLAQNKFLIRLCQSTETEIILAQNHGQSMEPPEDDSEPSCYETATDVAEMDAKRVKELEEATEECKEQIEELPVTFSGCRLFDGLSKNQKKGVSNYLAMIGAYRYSREEYEDMAASQPKWWNKEEEEILEELYGDSDEDEEEKILEELYSDSDEESEGSENSSSNEMELED
eukprot:CAMPEP_0113404272 /NCGR_PEP_ID=MMETSP0013_2-20120614/18292_1 /TAXON_ID=2843 ORGANISM="Skeletonema costatum, Strain 1716" /NCGR_SAMPLE_ID=MMETSP0013_2 /ASSEMBLY_ACC=CAM_ASM_000158 /LENGTH=564 /DNA_ID=CAMNT_0000289845 /DNA_START=30 /DNA_END=1724 /DNA_ORIENTATION=+ /assembly_acc=CAM_ASM_000158